jgi:hypothetical protein
MPKNTEKYGRNELGKFTEGNKGKPKGATNRTSREVKQVITDFLHDNSSDLQRIYDNLEDKDKATMLLHFSKLIVSSHVKTASEQAEQPLFPEILIDFTE